MVHFCSFNLFLKGQEEWSLMISAEICLVFPEGKVFSVRALFKGNPGEEKIFCRRSAGPLQWSTVHRTLLSVRENHLLK